MKTLKDLPRLQLTSRRDELIQTIVDDSDAICSEILKEEAIKWIKEYQYELGRPKISEKTIANLSGRIWILEHFFNLSVEELR